jgi:multiple sugar transport system substrate-binding protein
LQPYRDLAAAFQEQHPDVVIELETPNFGTSAINLADVAANSDCLQWYGGVTSEEEQAAVLNLEPFMDADPELGKADFYPQAIDAFSYQGQLWGLPAEMNVFLIAYNKALFDEAGLPYPQLDWTTDDFLETAVALTAGDDPETKQYGYVPQEFELNDLSAFLERLGAQFLDESVDPPQLAFTHPDTIEAMRWYTNLTTEFAVKPTFTTNIGTGSAGVGEERKTLIENGRAAMWTDQGFQSFPEINIDNLNVGIVPLPVGPDGTATAASAITGYFISSGTEQRQTCWEWIKFLNEQPNIGNYGNTIPAQPHVAESAAYAQAVGEEKAAANLASIENVTGPSASLRLSTDASWLSLGHFWWQSYAYDQILTAGIPVEEALTAVQAKADAYRDCIIDRNGLEDQNIQRTCLGEVDDTVPAMWIEVDE